MPRKAVKWGKFSIFAPNYRHKPIIPNINIMNKQITLQQAVEKVQDGMTIMFGGFLGNGSATQIIDAIV